MSQGSLPPQDLNGEDQRYRVLLADDDMMVREALAAFLRGEGYEVVEAADGRQALDAFRAVPVDLVLSDVKMPELDGLAVLKAVKDSDFRVPVVLISGYGDVETVLEALNSGADNFLQKPIRLGELRKVLDRLRKVESILRFKGDASICDLQESVFTAPSQPEFVSELVYFIGRSSVVVGFSNEDMDNNLKLALVEALTNAMEHGNRWDPDKIVKVRSSFTKDQMWISITDQGPGFDHSSLPDPTVDDHLFSERGRGVFLTRAIMDQVEYNDSGNQVILTKKKRASAHGA